MTATIWIEVRNVCDGDRVDFHGDIRTDPTFDHHYCSDIYDNTVTARHKDTVHTARPQVGSHKKFDFWGGAPDLRRQCWHGMNPVKWKQVTAERYYQMLNSELPELITKHGFLHGGTFKPFLRVEDRYYEGDAPISRASFKIFNAHAAARAASLGINA